ncbi:hypothetical protein ACFXG4_08595 [Nocardia sp. NPDC059246]|uniref:hypothetical protein n=1 Tax=unclassified Nocardia TaxID=2637762 RepID=UPI0036AF9431
MSELTEQQTREIREIVREELAALQTEQTAQARTALAPVLARLGRRMPPAPQASTADGSGQ